MLLVNKTKKTVLASNLKEASSIKDKFLGLLDKKNPRSLLFKTRFGIHTFLLKKNIDVLVLNPKKQVVKANTIKPNRIFLYNPIFDTVIELQDKAIETSKTKIGDVLEIKPNLEKKKPIG